MFYIFLWFNPFSCIGFLISFYFGPLRQWVCSCDYRLTDWLILFLMCSFSPFSKVLYLLLQTCFPIFSSISFIRYVHLCVSVFCWLFLSQLFSLSFCPRLFVFFPFLLQINFFFRKNLFWLLITQSGIKIWYNLEVFNLLSTCVRSCLREFTLHQIALHGRNRIFISTNFPMSLNDIADFFELGQNFSFCPVTIFLFFSSNFKSFAWWPILISWFLNGCLVRLKPVLPFFPPLSSLLHLPLFFLCTYGYSRVCACPWRGPPPLDESILNCLLLSWFSIAISSSIVVCKNSPYLRLTIVRNRLCGLFSICLVINFIFGFCGFHCKTVHPKGGHSTLYAGHLFCFPLDRLSSFLTQFPKLRKSIRFLVSLEFLSLKLRKTWFLSNNYSLPHSGFEPKRKMIENWFHNSHLDSITFFSVKSFYHRFSDSVCLKNNFIEFPFQMFLKDFSFDFIANSGLRLT